MNPTFQEILRIKLDEFWEYYRLLAEYKENPLPELVSEIDQIFDEIFVENTGYPALNDRLKAIADNKNKLFQVLINPDIPLHNNESELGARAQVRKRDVSLHTVTSGGTKAVDTFLSLSETTRKLGVNFFEYLLDRITKMEKIERLGRLNIMQTKMPDIIDHSDCKSSSNWYGSLRLQLFVSLIFGEDT